MDDGGVGPSVLVVSLVVVAAVVPAFVSGQAAYDVPVEYAPGEDDTLADPGSAVWARATTVDVPVTSAPSTVPNADNTSVTQIDVRSVRTDQRLYLRLSWPDESRDANSSDPREFPDALAVQFPVENDTQPGIAMGSPQNPVNVWYWSADRGGEELLAGGAGSTTRFQTVTTETTATYKNDRWTVVFSRSLEPDGANRTTFPADRDTDLAFAVWDGSNEERSGRKAVSEWYFLALGPGPQGPPYETLLWTIAGVAIVAVTAVTISAVRRT